MAEKYQWTYQSVGGVVRVNIKSGEDIAHLGELDQKKWTVLSCPANGLEFDQKTLSLLDSDGDGKIKVMEVVAAAQWLCSVIKDKDLILRGDSTLPLSQINTDNPEGAKLLNSAKHILSNLGLEKDSIDIADTSDSVAIFAKTKSNGDGVITVESVDEPSQKEVIEACVATFGGKMDRSGVTGTDAETTEKFYGALADYTAWKAAADADRDNVFPLGDDTAAACDAVMAVKDKVADFFMRCKLIKFDPACTDAVDVSAEKISLIRDNNLAQSSEQITLCPIARPCAEAVLPLDAINPAWSAQMASVKSMVLDKKFPGATTITEAQWNEAVALFDPFLAWKGARKGAEVEALGDEKIAALLKADCKQALLDAIAADAALKEESDAIDAVDKLLHYWKHFYKFLMNYVIFNNFYSPDPDDKAMFEVGELYIDQRCCKLCVKVEDISKHADVASLSGMFLLYCTCTCKKLGKTMDIVAALTDGTTGNLRPGRNAVFYDRNGQDWDAVVTKVVDNPISIRQAFWAPYVKFANFCSEKINKMAADKDNKLTADMQTSVADASLPAKDAKPQPKAFDIAKFAGIFAAIGMAFAGIGVALKALVLGIAALKWWQLILVLAAIMLIISGPSCFIAWRKLRKRNLGPVLNANGWAVNASMLVNIVFGSTLTSVAKYPVIKPVEPGKKGMPVWAKWLITVAAVAALCIGALYFTGNLGNGGKVAESDSAEVSETTETVEAVEAAPVN